MLIDWLTNWVFGWLNDLLTDDWQTYMYWLAQLLDDRLLSIDWLTDRLIDWEADILTCWFTD